MSRLRQPSLVLFLCLFTSQAGLLVLSPVLPEIAREFGVSTATAGQLRAISGLSGGLIAVLVAVSPRRPGLRDLLSSGALLVAIASVASAAAPSFALLGAAQALLGVGIGLLVTAGIAAAGEWPAPADRAHVLACAIAGMPCAWIAGMPVVGAVSEVDWRLTWLALPALAALVAFVLIRLRPADPPSARAHDAAALAAWRRPDVARFTAGELLANAAWASTLTYSGALLLGSYEISPTVVGLGLGAVAVAMLPGTFAARRHTPTPALLIGLTVLQGGAVLLLGSIRPTVVLSLCVLAGMAYVNGRRSMIASSLGMDTAPDDKVAVMALRAAANQFGYLLGAAAGGTALALGGFAGLGLVLAAMFAVAALIHAPARAATPVPAQ